MVKKGAIWRIQPDSMGLLGTNAGDEQFAGAIEWFRARAKHMSEAQKKIGKPNYTAQKIMQELRQAESSNSDKIHVTSYPSARIELTSESEKCMAQVKYLEQALWLYANDHNGNFPNAKQWQEIMIKGGFVLEETFICPAVGGELGPKRNDYVMVPWPRWDSYKEYDRKVKRDLLVVFECNPNHSNQRSVVSADHFVALIAEPEFRKKLAITIETLKAKGIDFQWSD